MDTSTVREKLEEIEKERSERGKESTLYIVRWRHWGNQDGLEVHRVDGIVATEVLRGRPLFYGRAAPDGGEDSFWTVWLGLPTTLDGLNPGLPAWVTENAGKHKGCDTDEMRTEMYRQQTQALWHLDPEKAEAEWRPNAERDRHEDEKRLWKYWNLEDEDLDDEVEDDEDFDEEVEDEEKPKRRAR
jgi:hypothetical protein